MSDADDQRLPADGEPSEASLHAAAQEARHIALGEMVGIVAHQLRQPLAGVSVMLDEIRERHRAGQLDTETLDQITERGKAAIQELCRTAEDFTRFLYPERSPRAFPLHAAMRTAVGLVEPTFRQAGIRLRSQVEPGLWIRGFPNELAQVLLALLQNAQEAFTGTGAADKMVQVDGRRVDEQVVITVEDNAGGIHPDAIAHLFDPYFTTKQTGTGIGLRLVRLLVERSLGGTITAGNHDGGARFVIRLPLARQS